MPDKPSHIIIAGNTFTPEDIDHLVTTAQEPLTEYQIEVQEELDRLEAERNKKATS